jgi:hypothetical protein
MALAQVVAGARIVTSDANQYYNILKGVTGSGETITLIYNAAASLIFQPSSDPAAGTQVLQVKNNAGTVQSALTYDGNALLKTSLTFSAAASKIIPGATSLSHRDTADAADNLLITDAGVVTVRSTLTVSGASLSVGTNPSTTGAARFANNSGGLRFRNAANSDNWNVLDVNGSNVVTLAQAGLDVLVGAAIEIDGDLNHDGSNVGFYGTAPIAKQTGVAVTAGGIHAALVALGLIAA